MMKNDNAARSTKTMDAAQVARLVRKDIKNDADIPEGVRCSVRTSRASLCSAVEIDAVKFPFQLYRTDWTESEPWIECYTPEGRSLLKALKRIASRYRRDDGIFFVEVTIRGIAA